MGWNRAKVHRIENAKTQTVKASDIRALCDLYQVGEDRKEAMVALAKRAANPGWWYEYSDLVPGTYLSLEAEATEMRTCELALIPGLLQTQDYGAALLKASGHTSQDEIRRRLEVRSVRQKVLDRAQPPQIWAVIDEAALRRPVGGAEVMRDQINHLIALSHRPFLDLQVLPLVKGAHAGLNGHFVILDFAVAPSVVYVEPTPDGLYLDKADIVKRYSLRFKRVQASALDTEDSLSFLTGLHDEYAR
jgi:hypothetical protein